MVRQFLDKTAVGPDDIPYWFWRNFSSDLAPVITIIFNRSLTEGIVPDVWKKISLTSYIMRQFERCVYQSKLLHVSESIDQDKFAYRKSLNSNMALIKCQYKWPN